jgi:hypothetical protein
MGGRRRLGIPGVGCPGESIQAEHLGKSGCSRLKYETISFGRRVADAMLPGKASKLQVIRTVL